jgi:hypothetical protein
MKQAVGAALAAVILGRAAPGSAATLIASGTVPASGGVSSVSEFIAFPPDIYFYTTGDYLFAEGEAAYDEIFGVITDAGASYGFVPAYFGAPATITSISNGFKVSFDLQEGDPPVHFDESYDAISDGYTAYHTLNYLGVQVSALFTQESAGSPYAIYDGPVADPFPSVVPEPAAWAMMTAGFAAAGAMLRRTRRRPTGQPPEGDRPRECAA